MSLIILTKSTKKFFSKEVIWGLLRFMFSVKRGPDAVSASIIRGLVEIRYPYLLNPKLKTIKFGDVVLVNGSIEALRQVIEIKKIINFKLVAGPNLVVTPDDYDGLINAPEIDLILQPSGWVRDFYLSISPHLSGKIKVWPAGVKVPKLVGNIRKNILVYIKNNLNDGQLQIIRDVLKGVKYEFIFYGKFKQAEYFDKLDNSKALLYFSSSESQGLAIQEAWARNIPTLVWDGGIWQYQHYVWHAKQISAPYLTECCGTGFSSFADLSTVFKDFLNMLDRFDPAKYVTEELSDKRSVEKMLSIINAV